MAKKLIIICPECSKNREKDVYIEAEPGFWNFLRRDASKVIKCRNGHTISMENGRMATKECATCKNDIVYDLLQGEDALCPVCKVTVNSEEDKHKNVTVSCPQCGCGMSVNKNAKNVFICPVCQHPTERIEKEIELVNIAKSGLASVIKYEGDNLTFVWKHPVEDFNIGSQLIVHESQEAIFFRNGAALDLFAAGRYTLETESIPLINNLYNRVLDPKDVFHSEVYFVNMSTQMGIKWGTDSKVRFLEPLTGIPLDIGASGEFNLRVSDSRKLVVKLVGTEGDLGRDKLLFTKDRPDDESSNKSVNGYFRAMIMTRVKTHLARTIKENQINILEIDEHLDSLSSALRARINEGLAEYGLMMPEFFVTTVVTPDERDSQGKLSSFGRLKQQHADLYLNVQEQRNLARVREAEAERMTVEERTKAQMRIIEAQGGLEVTKLDAAATKIAAGGNAEAYRLQAEAEAIEMQMKGYTYAQETQRQIGLEAVQGGVIKEGGGASGGVASGLGDVVGLGVTLGAIGGVMGLAKDAIAPIAGAASDIGKTVGSAVSTTLPQVAQIADGQWDCACGEKGIIKNFCSICGAKRPETQKSWDCPKCGEKVEKGLFCSNCGEKKPASLAWDCSCGEKSIKGNFCSNCGNKREVSKDA